LPLWIWIACKALEFFLHGLPGAIVTVIATVALTGWAALEIGWGVNLFRKILGSAVMLSILAGVCVKLWR